MTYKVCVVGFDEDGKFTNVVEVKPNLPTEGKWLIKVFRDKRVVKYWLVEENPLLDKESSEEFLQSLYDNNLIDSGYYRVHIPDAYKIDTTLFEGYIGEEQ